MPEIIRFDSLPVSRWHNGAGRKADIASAAEWHVGFAWLDADAPFSDFSGQDRTITLVEGGGFTLEFTGRPDLRVDEPHRPASFDGGWPTQCRVLEGPCLVLNAMTMRGRVCHTVVVSALDPVAEIIPPKAQAVFLVVLSGTVHVAGASEPVALHARDSLRLADPLSLHAVAGAVVCMIAIAPVTG